MDKFANSAVNQSEDLVEVNRSHEVSDPNHYHHRFGDGSTIPEFIVSEASKVVTKGNTSQEKIVDQTSV